MRWRVLTAVALILALLAGGIACRSTVVDNCGEIRSMLLQAMTDRQSGTLEKACVFWEQQLPLFSCVLTHDRLERVGKGLARASGFLQAGAGGEFVAQIEAVLYLLDDIRGYDDINLQTLL